MNKLISLISLGLSLGFAIALANTEDTAINRDSVDTANMPSGPDETHQQAGVAGGMNDESMPESSLSDQNRMHTCMDDKGTVFKPGQKGYNECMLQSDKKHPEQMGGTVEGETKKPKPSPMPTHR